VSRRSCWPRSCEAISGPGVHGCPNPRARSRSRTPPGACGRAPFQLLNRRSAHVEHLLVDAHLSVGSVWPSRYIARRGGTPTATPCRDRGSRPPPVGVPRMRALTSTNASGGSVSSVEPRGNVFGPSARRSSARFQRSEPSGSSAAANSSSARCSRDGLRTRLRTR
jgi:hypothetical protein